MYNNFIELINDIDTLADEVVDEELTPEEFCSRLDKIIENYKERKTQGQVSHCIDDLFSLCEVVASEQSTPDVIQEYLFYIIDHHYKYIKEKNTKQHKYPKKTK